VFGPDPVARLLGRHPVGFAHGHDVVVAEAVAAQVVHVLEHTTDIHVHVLARNMLESLRIGHVGQVRNLLHVAHRVKAKAVDALVQPPAHHLVHCGANLEVLPVQVGLAGREQVQEILPGSLVVLPRRALEDALPVVRLVARGTTDTALAIAPHVPVALGVVTGRTRLDEPGVLVAGVVDHQIEDQAHAPAVHLGQQVIEVGHGAELLHDRLVVGDVVAVVVVRRLVHRADPDHVDTERFEIVEARGDAIEIANAIAVGIHEAARVDLVGHRLLPPLRRHSRTALLFHCRHPLHGVRPARCGQRWRRTRRPAVPGARRVVDGARSCSPGIRPQARAVLPAHRARPARGKSC